jgi:hypothetical protein
MRRALLLAWRLHKWSLVALVVASVGTSVVAVLTAARLDELLADCRAATVVVVGPCGVLAEMGIIDDPATTGRGFATITVLAVLPFAAGVVLGAPLLAKEFEHGTALLAWPLARSRLRWLAFSLVPLALLGVVALLAPAMAGELPIRAIYPGLEPGANFEGYGARGPLLVLRFVAVLVVAALVGTWVRGQLPALLLAGVLAGGIGLGLMQAERLWVEPVERAGSQMELDYGFSGQILTDQRYRSDDGEWLSEEEVQAIFSRVDIPLDELPEDVFFVIPRERYPDVVLRESLALVSGTALVAALLAFSVQRRRPA